MKKSIFVNTALEEIRKFKNSYLLNEADEDTSGKDTDAGVDDLLKDLGGGEEETSDPLGGDAAEEGGEASSEEKPEDTKPEGDAESEEAKDDVDDQKKEVEAQAVEETDDDASVSMDMQIDDLLTKEEANSLNASDAENIVVDLFAQKALRLADSIDKFIDLPTTLIKRAEKFVRTRYGNKAAAQFQASVKPHLRKYEPGGVEEYYTQNTPDSFAAGGMGTGAGGVGGA